MKLFLTSSPIGIYRSNEPLDYSGFNPANGMTEELRRFWKDDARCLLISAFHDDYELNDRMRADYEMIVRDTGLPISCMDIGDSRNGREIADALHTYDFVILGGGHVPTENAFFKRIGLAEKFPGQHGTYILRSYRRQLPAPDGRPCGDQGRSVYDKGRRNNADQQ